MTIRTVCACDGCGNDLTVEPRFELAVDFRDCPATRADDFIHDGEPKHFCGLACAAAWGGNYEQTHGR